MQLLGLCKAYVRTDLASSSTRAGLVQVAVTHIPAPSTILLCQLLSCSVFVKGLAVAKVVDAEPLQLEKVKAFALIVFGFIGTLFSSMTALQVSTEPRAI